MSRRALLALSAAAAAFVLVLGGAAAGLALRSPTAPSPGAAAEVVPVDLVRAREAEYRRLLEEANAQLRAPEPALAPAPLAQPDPPREHRERGRHHERHEDDDG